MGDRLGAAVTAARRTAARWPLHVALAALVGGVCLGPRQPALVGLVAALVVLVQPRRGWLVAALVVAVGGTWVATTRLADAERRATAPLRAGPDVQRARAVALDAPEITPEGARRGLVTLRGATVEVRAPPWAPRPWAPGDVLAVEGELGPLPPEAVGPRAQGVRLRLRATDVAPTGRVRDGPLAVADAVRRRAERTLAAAGLPPEREALLRGMVLGQADGLTPDQEEAFRRSGLAHLVAASGANVALLVALVLALGAVAGVPRTPRYLLALGAIVLYVPVAGGGPSIVRAGIMGALGVLALLLGRPADRWWALLVAAALTATVDPHAPDGLGWRLSFAAVVGLLLAAGPGSRRLRRLGLPPGVAEAAAVTLAAGASTAPVLAAATGTGSLISPLANVLVDAVVAPVTWLGTLAAALGPEGEPLSGLLVRAAGPLVGWVDGVARWAAAPRWAAGAVSWWVAALAGLLVLGWLGRPVPRGTGGVEGDGPGDGAPTTGDGARASPSRDADARRRPWAVVRGGTARRTGPAAGEADLPLPPGTRPPPAAVARAGALLAEVEARGDRGGLADPAAATPASGGPRRRTVVVVAVLVALAAGAATTLRAREPPPAPSAEVRVLDVGQGAAVLVRAGSHAALFDAGPDGGRTLDRLRRLGVRRLDALLLSHAAADHTGGAPVVARAMRPRILVDGRDGQPDPAAALTAAVVRAGGGRVHPGLAGLVLRAGGLRLEVLWPRRAPGPPVPDADPNLRALVVDVRVGGLRAIAPSDVEGPDLRRAIGPGRVDLLVMPHHGSADPDLPRLLAELRPGAVAIPVGDGNPYGHPAPQALAALAGGGVRAWRTDRDGDVAVRPGPRGPTVHAED